MAERGFEPGHGLRLCNARLRMQRAVLATLIGPTDPTVSYAGGEKADSDYREMAAAGLELANAQAAWEAYMHEKAAARGFPDG
jgi:hypothetical protein